MGVPYCSLTGRRSSFIESSLESRLSDFLDAFLIVGPGSRIILSFEDLFELTGVITNRFLREQDTFGIDSDYVWDG